MSITDSTQLEGHVSAGIAVAMKAPKVTASARDGDVALLIDTLTLIFSANDALLVAASLATAAATAAANKSLRLVAE